MATPMLEALRQDPILQKARHFIVGYSGGIDSTVLLHLCRAVLPRRRGATLVAFHVNHQLHRDASQWQMHCASMAGELGVRFESVVVDASPQTGASPEAAARQARYAALASYIDAGDVILTAHNEDDQAETLLLQMLRGGGVAGQAGMPELHRFHGGWQWRPLLHWSRQAIHDYAVMHDLQWFDDPSNSDTRIDRNYLRKEILPLLRRRWPATSRVLARAARHAATAQRLQDQLAAIDLQQIADSSGQPSRSRLLALDDERQANVLRHWLVAAGLPVPSTVQMKTLLSTLAGARGDSETCFDWPGGQLRLFRDRLYAMSPLPVAPGSDWSAHWHGETLPLPAACGQLEIQACAQGGFRRALLDAGLTVQFRRGGEGLRPAAGATRKLRNLYQEAGIVPWMRQRIPLLFVEDRLAAVADLWIDSAFVAPTGETGVQIRWYDHPPLY